MSGGGASILEVRDLAVRYGNVTACEAIELDVPRRAIMAIVGPSGCGKTSLLRAVAGFERPTRGSIRLEGRLVAGPDCWIEPDRRQVGMVFQQGALFPHMTVEHNVGYGLRGRSDATRRATESLELVGLARLARRFPDELSGGQQQRVALARALAPSPRIVLLDEPFANLDAALRHRLRQQIRDILLEAGATALIVTHDQEEALETADRIVVMDQGRVLQDGTPREVYLHPDSTQVARFMGDGMLLPCHAGEGCVQSILGDLDSESPPADGMLLVRPENVRMSSEGSGRGIEGQVVRRRYFGHDQLDEVRLSGGQTVHVRIASSSDFATGQAVRLSLRPGVYTVYSSTEPNRRVGQATVAAPSSDTRRGR